MEKFKITGEKKLSVEESCRLFKTIANKVGGKPIMDIQTRKDIINFSKLYTPGTDWTAQIAFEFGFEEALAVTQLHDRKAAYEAKVAIYQAAVGLYPKAHPCQKSRDFVEKNFDFNIAASMAKSGYENEDNRRISGWVIISQQAKKNLDAKQYFLQYFSKLTEEEKSKIKNVLEQQALTSQPKLRP